MNSVKNSRAPKQLGDFGECFINYILNKKFFEVAHVDHVGADLIAEKDKKVYAISVKTRKFRPGSKESRMYCIERQHLKNLIHFAKQFKMIPIIAIVINIEDEKILEAYIIKVVDIFCNQKYFPVIPGKGYSFNFYDKNRRKVNLRNCDYVDYSCYKEEKLGNKF